MGNLCYENRNIDEGNIGSDKQKYNIINKNQEKNDININNSNKISNSETKIINTNSVPNILEVNNIENDFNELDNNIPLNPPLYPNKIIPENIINSAKKLKLIILQSKYLTEGKEYIINAGGLLGSKRKAKDGITFFGDKSVRI